MYNILYIIKDYTIINISTINSNTAHSLANGKAVGPDGVSVELFEIALNGDPTLRRRLLDIVACIWWGGGEVPQQWKDVTNNVLHKKRDRTKRGNYRGISLEAHPGKILLKIIARRLSEYYKRVRILSEEQWFPTEPFYHRYYVRDSLATGVGVEETNFVVCLLDLTKGYDSVDRTLLSTLFARFGVPQNMILAIQFHDGMQACVRLDHRVCSRWFAVKQGLRERCVLAPLLSTSSSRRL